jgi:hypothetical protein
MNKEEGAERVTDVAIELALLLACPVEVLHVIETGVREELALDLESYDAAMDVTSRNVARVRAVGLAGDGHLLRSSAITARSVAASPSLPTTITRRWS